MTTHDEATTVTIRLLEKDYRISCEPHERDELKQAADLLGDKLQEIRDAQVVGLDRIAVMAALNLAHELLLANRSLDTQRDQGQRLDKINERMDKEIQAFNDYRNALL